MRTIALVLGLLILVGGCATTRVETGTRSEPAADQQALYALRAWRMEGRIAITTATETRQGSLFWEHDQDQDRLRISGPFNQGAVSIVLQKDLIYINRGDGQTELSREPDALLRERLGVSIPLDNLRFWILGLPAPLKAYQQLPAGPSTGSGFRQSGWAIYAERSNQVGSLRLPQKLRVEGVDVILKIVADDWTIRG